MSSAMRKGRRVPFGVVGVMVFAYLSCATLVGAVPCEDIKQGGFLRVLTLNLLFSELEQRDRRLDRIADFIDRATQDKQEVHLILLQEVAGGLLAGTQDSSQDLHDKLAERGESYELRSRYETGVPGILVVKNAAPFTRRQK